MGGRRVLWMLAVSGCAYVWRVDELPPVDAPGIDSPIDAPVCTPPAVPTADFMGSGGCPSWSQQNGGTATGESAQAGSGTLTLTKTTTGPVSCEAKSASVFSDVGYFVAIEKPFTTLSSYTTLTVLSTNDESASPKWSMTVDGGGSIHFDVDNAPQNSGMPWVKATMRFVRIRPDMTTQEAVGEYSGDAIHWTELGRAGAGSGSALPQQVYVDIAAGISGALDTNPDTAAYSHLDVCP